MNAAPYFTHMPEKAIDVVEPNRRARKGYIEFNLGRDVSFSTEALESFAFARWEPMLYDTLVVAAAVEYGDRIVKRPSHGWARRFSLRIPVHDPARWNAPEVAHSLQDAVEFLTGDYWAFNFVQMAEIAPPLRRGMLPLSIPTQAVIAYSDGMDSRAVARIVGAKLGNRLVRVRVGTKTSDRPRSLGSPEPFTAVPYKVASNMPNRETSARSRGFKFALVAGLAAYLTDASEVVIPESGQGIFGPAIVTVGHVYPDFRNHPFFTWRMDRFLNALLGKNIRYVFPRMWSTKGETLREYVAIDQSDKWRTTWSCWRNNQWSAVSNKRRQCGICAACMLRRLSVHSAGLNESQDTYICEDLATGTIESAADPAFTKLNRSFREYALAGALHLDHFADLGTEDGKSQITRHAASLAPILGLSHQDASTRLFQLVEQHAMEWKTYVNALGRHSFLREWVRAES